MHRRRLSAMKPSLQSIFEGSYSFDIDALKKQNLGKAEKDLEKVNGTTPFVRAYVTQNALGGHSIPISKGDARCAALRGGH